METPFALLTGGSGYIGSYLGRELLEAGWRVRTIGRRSVELISSRSTEHQFVDLSKPVDPKIFEGITHLFHLAGASSTNSSDDEMFVNNVIATKNLFSAIPTSQLKSAIYMSTTAVYGEKQPLPQPIEESVTPSPSREYGRTKLQAEQQAITISESKNLNLSILRPVSVYGPGNIKLLASAMLDVAIEVFSKTINVLALPAPVVELRLVHIQDVLDACIHLAILDKTTNKVFNLTSGQYPSSEELARILASAFNLEFELSKDPNVGLSLIQRKEILNSMYQKGMSNKIVFTDERLRFLRRKNINNILSIDAIQATGWTPTRTDLMKEIKATLDWYYVNNWLI